MPRALLVFLLLASCGGSESNPVESDPIPEPDGWKLVWNDEFEGTDISEANWNHWVTGNPYNNELQYYTRRGKNSFVENGILSIVAHKEDYTDVDGTRQYTSARLNTSGKADFLYGRFEIKAKLPRGQGIWPAIWMLPTDNAYGGWPRSGEIDIMELVGHEPSVVHGTLHHTQQNSPSHAYAGSSIRLPSGTFADDFHVFAIEWKEGQFDWYLDGELFRTQRQWASYPNPYPAPFDKRFHLLLNLAVGGDWPGNPNASTVFPQTMEVDYVRVYERAD